MPVRSLREGGRCEGPGADQRAEGELGGCEGAAGAVGESSPQATAKEDDAKSELAGLLQEAQAFVTEREDMEGLFYSGQGSSGREAEFRELWCAQAAVVR